MGPINHIASKLDRAGFHLLLQYKKY